MRSVLCVAGLDPAGHSGLSADMRALAFLGIRVMPVAATLTVQNIDSFIGIHPVDGNLLKSQIEKILEEARPDAVKVGMLGDAHTVGLIAKIVGDMGVPIVTDPVFASSTGFSLLGGSMLDAYKYVLVPVSTLVTPNAYEASALADLDVTGPEAAGKACEAIMGLGAKAVLVKGGHFTDSPGTDVFRDSEGMRLFAGQHAAQRTRGTGCTYSALIAGYLASGLGMRKAVERAKNDMALVIDAAVPQGYGQKSPTETRDPEFSRVMDELDRAVSEILSILPAEYVAEVGNNMVYAVWGAAGPGDVCSLDSRILLKGGRVTTLGMPVFGRDSHVGRVVLAAMNHDPGIRCAINLKYSSGLLERLRRESFSTGCFDRSEEPESTSSMDWGTGKAIKDIGYVPDAIYDLGSCGKEPMVRLLARSPVELVQKLRRISES